MKILFVTQYFPPEMGAPAARVAALVRRWVARGHEVAVVTAFPNHPTGVIPEAYRGAWRRIESWHGARLVRTFIYAAPNKGVVKRSLAYASFAASSVVQGYGPAGRPDVVVATSPQFLVALSGWALSRLRGVPLVLEVRDLWPDSIVAVGAAREGSALVRALRAAERFAYAQADLVVAVTRSFVPHLIAHGARRTAVITNGADPDVFRPSDDREGDRAAFGLGDRFVAAFVGTLGMAHGLETVLDAAERLRGAPEFLFWLVGDGARRAELEAEARRRGLSNVRFEGQVPRERVPAALGAADAALVVLRPDPLFETVLPSKMFEAMALERPVVLGVRGEARDVLVESGGGLPVEPGDAEALAQAVRRLAADRALGVRLGAAGRRFVVARYSHDAMARAYEIELAALVGAIRG